MSNLSNNDFVYLVPWGEGGTHGGGERVRGGELADGNELPLSS